MTTNHKMTCTACGEDAILETTDLVDEWPRELIYICPHGHKSVVVECSDPKSMPSPAPTDPNLPVKHTYKMDARPEQEIELYHGASTVRSKIGQSNHKAHSYLNTLEDYVNGAIIQHHRIQEDNWMLNAYMELSQQHPLDISHSQQDKFLGTQLALFLDIHFYLICLDKIEKLYPQFLSSIALSDKGKEDRRQRRINKRLVRSKFRQALTTTKNARNFLEHIEQRILYGKFDGLHYEADESGDRFICGKGEEKHRVDIKLKTITDAYEALIKMLHSLPDLD